MQSLNASVKENVLQDDQITNKDVHETINPKPINNSKILIIEEVKAENSKGKVEVPLILNTNKPIQKSIELEKNIVDMFLLKPENKSYSVREISFA